MNKKKITYFITHFNAFIVCVSTFISRFHLFSSYLLTFFSYPPATAEDLSQNSDNCAICWEKMESARKLPCSHLFHKYVRQFYLSFDAFLLKLELYEKKSVKNKNIIYQLLLACVCVSFSIVLVCSLGWNKTLVVPLVVVVSAYTATAVNTSTLMRYELMNRKITSGQAIITFFTSTVIFFVLIRFESIIDHLFDRISLRVMATEFFRRSHPY